MRTITAMFDSRADAETARSRLAAAGISEDHVSIHDKASVADRGQASASESAAGQFGTSRSTDTHSHAHSDATGNHDDVADGREGTRRNAIGDYIDNRTGDKLMEHAGSERNAIGDYIDSGTGDRVGEDAGSDRNALGDFKGNAPGHVGGSDTRHDNNRHDSTSHTASDDGHGLWHSIKSFFIGDDELYEEGMRRGGHVLTARVSDADVDRAIDILDDEGTVDLDQRAAAWETEGWSRRSNALTGTSFDTGTAPTAIPGTMGTMTSDRPRSRVRNYEWNETQA